MWSSTKNVFLIIVFLVQVLSAIGIQVEIYPNDYIKKKPPNIREATTLKITVPEYDRQVKYSNSRNKEIIRVKESPLSDAIRIVEPPQFFQEQKKQFNKKAKIQYGNQGIKISLKKTPQSFPSKHREQLHRAPTYSPKFTPSPTKFIVAHQSISVQHPRPAPAYLGIEIPNHSSIRGQIKRLKERQRAFFEDDLDEHPARPTRPSYLNHNAKDAEPLNFGHDIYIDARNNFEKSKQSYFGVKPYSVKEEPNEQPLSSQEPLFTPYRSLASVRHVERFTHKPRNPSNPRAKKRVRTQHTQTVHSEQIFEDSHVDHDDEIKHFGNDKNNRIHRSVSNETENKGINLRRRKRALFKSKPKPKEHIRTQRTRTVYSEQGYEDTEYDHGDEDRHVDEKHKHRKRRGIIHAYPDVFIDKVEELPVALSLINPKGEQLQGQDLLKHVSQVLNTTSKYLSVDTNSNDTKLDSIILEGEDLENVFKRSVTINPSDKIVDEKSTSHVENDNDDEDGSDDDDGNDDDEFTDVHHVIDISHFPVNSAINYAEKLSDFNESPYDKEVDCEEIEPDFEQNEQKKKLGYLASHIDCFKKTYFGDNPLNNPFFTEEITSPKAFFLKRKENNPSNLVYDDVMRNIKSSQYTENILTLRTRDNENIPAPSPTRSPNYPKPSVIPPDVDYKSLYAALPIFDITKYFPKIYMIRSNGKVYSIKLRPASEQFKQIPVNNYNNPSRTGIIIHTSTTSTFRPPNIDHVQRFTEKDALRKPLIRVRI